MRCCATDFLVLLLRQTFSKGHIEFLNIKRFPIHSTFLICYARFDPATNLTEVQTFSKPHVVAFLQ